MKKRKEEKSVTVKENKDKLYSTVKKLLLLILVAGAVFAFYRLMLLTPIFPFVLGAYIVALVVLIFVYILYNRGMSRSKLTEDMLPDEWSYDMKREYIEDGKRRLKKTEWMLMVILGLMLTFAFEFLELKIIPLIEKIIAG